MTKDYYKILDIPEFSSSEEIKSAYRKLARLWHPDVAGSSPDVISRFKEINEAYEILSDKMKKADYDTARRFYSYGTQNRNTKSAAGKSSTNPSYKETFTSKKEDKKSSFWGSFFNSQVKNEETKAPQKGEDIYSDIDISIFEAINGATKIINMLQTQVCPKCGGRKFVNGGNCSYCKGKGEISTYKRFSVKIPAGIKDKSKIRLAEEGEKGKFGGRNGDLYLTIHIRETKGYKTEGLNILKTIYITPSEAVLGGQVSVSTLAGNVSLKISPNTRSGQKIRLSGCGISQNNKVGDMIVTVEIQIPKNLSSEEINLYKRLQEISSVTSSIRERLE